jgi:hypothetical protein
MNRRIVSNCCSAGCWLALLIVCFLHVFAGTLSADSRQYTSVGELMRKMPYQHLKAGVAENWKRARRDILLGEGICRDPKKHVLLSFNGEHVATIGNRSSKRATQSKINRTRRQLAKKRREGYVLGTYSRIGYPFAFGCDAEYSERFLYGVKSYFGKTSGSRLKGSWKGVHFRKPASIRTVLKTLDDKKRRQGKISYPKRVSHLLFGLLAIESGGYKKARSKANARGILQILPSQLKRCGVPRMYYYHRIAQADCALTLLESIHRHIYDDFLVRFRHLPRKKGEELYARLMVQSYHTGMETVRKLLNGRGSESKAARYYAKHQHVFSAADIALGMMMHNIGRGSLRIGLASARYVIDAEVGLQALEAYKRKYRF